VSNGRITNPSMALVYMTECTLATVDAMAMRKRRPKYEYKRQKSIAQAGIDWIRCFNVEVPKESPRVNLIVNRGSGWSVDEWAKQYEWECVK
jgi:hypothetical protein